MDLCPMFLYFVKMMSHNMEITVIFLSSAFLLINGFNLEQARFKRQTEEIEAGNDCLQPPVTDETSQCCQPPKKHIWGNLRESIKFCSQKMKENISLTKNKKTKRESDVLETSTFPDMLSTEEQRGGKPRRRGFSEWVKESVSTFKSAVEKAYEVLQLSILILTDSFRNRLLNACFMECVFDKEGFLLDNKVNKQALLDRLQTTLQKDDVWYPIALSAVETCMSGSVVVPIDSTCQSGSEEILRCIFREMFLGCPNWMESNESCTSLREFYRRCPNAPPPEIFHKRKMQNNFQQSDNGSAAGDSAEGNM